ncbi:MAG TPA: hypothetical protein VMF08_15585 [Candidatus Sulfotelmatobacter sp.]|nr:hypothetical protein [Candidatus Sulfotelmatobacter sp.]
MLPVIEKTNEHGSTGYKDFDHPDLVSNEIPLIQFEDVPITVALYNLARQAGLNYMLDPDLFGYWYTPGVRQPILTLKWTNVTAEQAFTDICAGYGFVLTRDPRTGVIFVRHREHDVKFMDSEFYGKDDTNTIPLIEFQDVPLSIALENLARQARIKCILSPRIDTSDVGTEPSVNIRWQNITASHAFAAICEGYNLDLTKNPASGLIRVEPEDYMRP